MIRLAHILPSAYLSHLQTELKPFHLVLAHQVLKDDHYRAFYTQRRQAGDYILLDNSAFELGEAIDDDSLLQAIDMLQPHEVVLPDALGDATKTYERVLAFLARHRSLLARGVRFMAVPHGRDLNDYMANYRLLDSLSGVHTLGIGTIYNKRLETAIQPGRRRIFAALQHAGVLSNKAHHLLGLGDSGHLELQVLKRYSQIRSCDSSAAYMQARHGQALQHRSPYNKVADKINLHDTFQTSLLKPLLHNMRILQEASQ